MLNKLSLISDKVPSISLKTSKNGDVLQRLPWDCSNFVRKRKCKEFDRDPCLANFNVASYKQKVYENAEIKAKMKYEKKITKSKSNIRKSVNKLHKSDGSETKSPLETAEVLADFFHSVFQPEPFGPLPKDCYSKRSKVLPESDFLFNYFLENELLVHPESVTKLLKELDVNKSMGPDGVHPKLIKYLSQDQSFVDAIVLLFRACITERCIPEVWKTAIVVALYKKGSVHNPNEYRPVSLTCILCKVYEKLVREYILEGIEKAISSKQHGFTRGRSCLSNLLETIDVVNDLLAEGGCADILYFDFSKAFDSVPHHRLLIKLKGFGIPDYILDILEDFLVGRSMRVKVLSR